MFLFGIAKRLSIYLTVFLVFTMIAVFASTYFSKQIIQYQDEKIHAYIKSEALKVGAHLNTIDNIMTLNYQKIRAQNIIRVSKPLSNLDRYDVYMAITSLARANTSITDKNNWPLLDTMLFFTKSGIAISTSTMYTLESLVLLRIGTSFNTFTKILQEVEKSDSNRRLVRFTNYERTSDLYFKVFSIRGSKEKVIGISFIDSTLFDFEGIYNGFSYISTKEGNIIKNGADIQLPTFEQLSIINNTQKHVLPSISSVLFWQPIQREQYLVSIIPNASYNLALITTNLLIFITIFTLYVIACLVIYRVRKKQQKSLIGIEELINTGLTVSKVSDGIYDNVKSIHDGIIELIDQNRSLYQKNMASNLQIKKISISMRDSFIRMIILNMIDSNELIDLLNFYNIDIKFNRFRVLLFQVVSTGIPLDVISDAKKALAVAIISIIDMKFEICSIDDTITAVLLMFDEPVKPETYNTINSHISNVLKVLKERFNIRVYSALGTEVTSYEECHFSYYSARIVLLINTKLNVFSAEHSNIMTEYEKMQITKILNALEKGETDRCLQTFDAFFEPIDNVNYSQNQQFNANMLFVLFNEILESSENLKKHFANNMSFRNTLYSHHTFAEILQIVREMLKHTSENIAIRGENRGQIAVNKALKIIHEKYLDANLSQTEIAESISINVSTLSLQFKEIVGVTMTSYIRNLRVEKVKQLLISENDAPMDDIANNSGFNSIKTMYRVFKSQTNMTPGQFRKLY